MTFRTFPLEDILARLRFEDERYRMMVGVNLAQEQRIRDKQAENVVLSAQNTELRVKIVRQREVIGWKFYWMVWWRVLQAPRWDGFWVCIGMVIGATAVVIVAALLFLGFIGMRLHASSHVQAYADAGSSQVYDLYGVPTPT